MKVNFVDAYRGDHGVEPMCACLEIAPSTYYSHVRRREHPETASPRVKEDEQLMTEIRHVCNAHFQVYGVRKVWHQLKREGHDIGRCRVERLMRKMGIFGVIRGAKTRRMQTSASSGPAVET